MEFAIVGPVFFFMLFATIEYGVYFFKKSVAQHVLYETSRVLQTGQVQRSDNPETEFQAVYCEAAMTIFDCNDISFDVRAFDSMADIVIPDATFNSSGRPTNFVFQPGKGEQITALRVSIPHQFITPMMRDIFQPDGTPAIIVGYSISKNEPF